MAITRRSLRFLSLAYSLLLLADLALDSVLASANAAFDGRTRNTHPARTGRDGTLPHGVDDMGRGVAMVGDHVFAGAPLADDLLGSDNGIVQIFAVDELFTDGFDRSAIGYCMVPSGREMVARDAGEVADRDDDIERFKRITPLSVKTGVRV